MNKTLFYIFLGCLIAYFQVNGIFASNTDTTLTHKKDVFVGDTTIYFKANNNILDLLVSIKSIILDSTQNSIIVPFRLSGNLILIEAELNQNKGFFIFDSGAPDLKVNSIYFKESKSQSTSASGGITGKVANVTLQPIQNFKWNIIELKNTKVQGFDMSHIEKVRNEKILGLIGLALFKDFELLLDYKKSQLILYKLDKSGNRLHTNQEAGIKHTVKFEMQNHIPFIYAKVDKFSLKLGLDTGAETNILDKNVNKKIFQFFTITRRAVLNGNGQDKIEVLAGKLQIIKLDKLAYTDMRTIVTNMQSMNESFDTKLDGMLGFEFFSRKKTALNFYKKEMYIWE